VFLIFSRCFTEQRLPPHQAISMRRLVVVRFYHIRRTIRFGPILHRTGYCLIAAPTRYANEPQANPLGTAIYAASCHGFRSPIGEALSPLGNKGPSSLSFEPSVSTASYPPPVGIVVLFIRRPLVAIGPFVRLTAHHSYLLSMVIVVLKSGSFSRHPSSFPFASWGFSPRTLLQSLPL
jgi:hypothetical protein